MPLLCFWVDIVEVGEVVFLREEIPFFLLHLGHLHRVLGLRHRVALAKLGDTMLLHLQHLVRRCQVLLHRIAELLPYECTAVVVAVLDDIVLNLLLENLWHLLDEVRRFEELEELSLRRDRLIIDVACEKAGLLCAVLEDHQPDALLQTIVPVAVILCPVRPLHLTVAALLICLIMALVRAAGVPAELTVPIFLVCLVAAFVLITFGVAALLPLSMAIFLPVEELTRIRVAVHPCVLAIALGFPVQIFSDVGVANRKAICALPVAQAVLPLALIDVAIAPIMLSEAVRLVLLPLPSVGISLFFTAPATIAGLRALVPLAVENVAVSPGVLTLAIYAAHLVLAFVDVLITEDLEALPVPLVVAPLAFVDTTGLVNNNAFAMPLAIDNVAAVDRF